MGDTVLGTSRNGHDRCNEVPEEACEDLDFEHLDIVDESSSSLSVQGPKRKGPDPFHSYVKSFMDQFLNSEADTVMRKACKEGKFKSHQFRHIVWSILLDLLPSNFYEWNGLICSRREQYRVMKEFQMKDKRGCNGLDPEIDNPLSQDDASPWNKYFADNSLREEIVRDVVRTHSHHPMFKRDAVKEMMVDILFIYAKKFPCLSYRQGMHEILASCLMVQYDCCKEYLRCANLKTCGSNLNNVDSQVISLIRALNNPDHLEADGFFLFERFMERIWDWYHVSDSSRPPARRKTTHLTEQVDKKLFDTDDDTAFMSPAVKRLRYLWDNTFQRHDPDLHKHLEELYILPTTFGTNWTRLLFQRQCLDYLMLWDALIATNFTLVDFVVVAMVVSIRSLLMAGDNISCNTLLVSKYPESVDVRYILNLALHLQDPTCYASPKQQPFILDPRKWRRQQQQRRASTGSSSGRRRPAMSSGGTLRNMMPTFSTDPPILTGRAFERERKMVNLSGRSILEAREQEYVFLEDEPSYSGSIEEITSWHNQLRESLRDLNRGLDMEKAKSKKLLATALKSVEDVADKMLNVIKSGDYVPDHGIDVLNQEGNGDELDA